MLKKCSLTISNEILKADLKLNQPKPDKPEVLAPPQVAT